jgi:branched-chain amino acid transport system permease protein
MGFISSVALPLILSAAVLTGIYILVSVGFSLVFGVMTVVNLAHGLMVVTYLLYENFGISPVFAVVAIIPLMFVLGYAVQIIGLENVLEDLETNSILLTFGLLIAGEAVLRTIFSNQSRSINYLSETVGIFGATTSAGRIVAGIGGFFFVGVFGLFLAKSKYGQAIRATAQAPRLAEACGINSQRIRAITMGLGSVLAGLGGVSYVMVYNVSPVGGRHLLLIAFVVTVLGGLGSLKGAAVAAVIVAFIQTIIGYYAGPTEALFLLYMLVVVLLLVKPHGLFGEEREYYHA